MQVPSGPKGTRDFYPDEIMLREHIFSSWEKTCRRYGFELYDAPMFEHLELYTQKSGPEIEKQLYTFQDKAGRNLALRPELTPSLARMVAAKGNSIKRPLKWFSVPKLFRYEKMQKGRLREFFQLNMDILGIAEVSADAELIAAAIDMMRDLGFTADEFTIHISSRTLLDELFATLGLSGENRIGLYAALDHKDKVSADDFKAELLTVVGDASVCTRIQEMLGVKTLDDVAKINPDLPSLGVLRELFALLGNYGMSDFAAFDIGVVRGLAYYTGIVFEVFDKKRTMRAIAGGGRYDQLVKMYGGQDTPAVGFAAGDVVLGDLLREKGVIPAPSPRCEAFIVSFDDAYPSRSIAQVQVLRGAGISAEMPLKKTGIGNQLKLADAARARWVVFCGGEEEKNGLVKVKNMHSGIETTVDRSDLINHLKSSDQ